MFLRTHDVHSLFVTARGRAPHSRAELDEWVAGLKRIQARRSAVAAESEKAASQGDGLSDEERAAVAEIVGHANRHRGR
jgi:hypothetical protein